MTSVTTRQKEDQAVGDQQAKSTQDLHNGELRRWMIAAIGCVLAPRSAVYVSTPITTGERFVRWHRTVGTDLPRESAAYRDGLFEAVIAPNRTQVTPLIAALRERFSRPVIDPTALEVIPGWEQFDYHSYWAEVIERYADTVVFVDGWEYSSGCVRELTAAVGVGAALLREDLAPLAPADAARRVERAIGDVATDGVLSVVPLHEALAALRPVLDDAMTRTAPVDR